MKLLLLLLFPPKVIELGTTIFLNFAIVQNLTQTKEVVPHFYMFWD